MATTSSNMGGVTIIPKPRKIIFCLHGMLGTVNSFNGFEKQIHNEFPNDADFLSIPVTVETSVSEIKSEVNYRAWFNNKIMYVKVGFLNNRGYVSEQVDELNIIISKFINIFPKETLYSLQGHSKGGLVAIDYVNKYGNQKIIDKILTFGTPYNHEIHNAFANDLGLDKTIGNVDLMKEIKTKWNALPASFRPTVFAIGISSIALNVIDLVKGWTDGVVSSSNAMGKNFVGITGINWEKYSQPWWNHKNILNKKVAATESINRLT